MITTDKPATIHFFPRFSKNANTTAMAATLERIGGRFKIIGSDASQRYRSRLELLLLNYPKLAWSSLFTAIASMLRSPESPPDYAVISSDVEALVFAAVRMLPFARRPSLVFMPFIFTARSSALSNRLRVLYYRFVMRRVGYAVCHSQLEVARYERVFAGCGTRFIFVPWGGHVPSRAEVIARVGPLPDRGPVPILTAAGKSGRDYPLFIAAAAAAGCHARIICNVAAPFFQAADGVRLTVLPDCFGYDYLWELMRADVVVVPLSVDDISAGQMVVIQAMALGCPLIVTATRTVADYLTDGVNALLVPIGDAGALQQAIHRLTTDTALRTRLTAQAQDDFVRRFSEEAHFRSLVQQLPPR